MPQLNVYGAGMRHAYVKVAEGTVYDIDAIFSQSGEPTQDEVQIVGDDVVKATFFFNQREELELVANGISFDALQAITGNTYSSSVGGVSIPLGTDSEVNPPFIEVGFEVSAKEDDNTTATVTKVWHKVQLGTVTIDTSNGSELSVTMAGVAYKTALDIEGATLTPSRIATLSTVIAS